MVVIEKVDRRKYMIRVAKAYRTGDRLLVCGRQLDGDDRLVRTQQRQ